MSVIKSFFIAFSIYSKVPVPQFVWKDEDMRYTLCFFPWVGLLIGALVWGWMHLCVWLGIGKICTLLIGTAIPLLVTGGFHIDGYMDMMDAIHSYQPREKKLEIMKDAHIGAFAVIMLVLYYLIYIAAFSEIKDSSALAVFCFGFYLSRILSGIGVVTFRSAKAEGLLYTFANTAQESIVKISLYGQLILCVGIMGWISWKTQLIVVGMALLAFVYYRYRSYREFGGITGDTAGYFVSVCEAGMAVVSAISCLIK